MVSIEIVKGEELIKKYQGDIVKPSTKQPFRDLVLKTENEARKATVVDTGRLRSSISHQIQDMSATIGTNVEYAPFIEFGTWKMDSRHMEGSRKVLGQGMFEYTVETMAEELKEFEVKVISNVEKELSN